MRVPMLPGAATPRAFSTVVSRGPQVDLVRALSLSVFTPGSTPHVGVCVPPARGTGRRDLVVDALRVGGGHLGRIRPSRSPSLPGRVEPDVAVVIGRAAVRRVAARAVRGCRTARRPPRATREQERAERPQAPHVQSDSRANQDRRSSSTAPASNLPARRFARTAAQQNHGDVCLRGSRGSRGSTSSPEAFGIITSRTARSGCRSAHAQAPPRRHGRRLPRSRAREAELHSVRNVLVVVRHESTGHVRTGSESSRSRASLPYRRAASGYGSTSAPEGDTSSSEWAAGLRRPPHTPQGRTS